MQSLFGTLRAWPQNATPPSYTTPVFMKKEKVSDRNHTHDTTRGQKMEKKNGRASGDMHRWKKRGGMNKARKI